MKRNYLLVYRNKKIDKVEYEFFETEEDMEKAIELFTEINKDIQIEIKLKVNEIQNKPKRPDPYTRNKMSVYATGNKWAIENWNATHN